MAAGNTILSYAAAVFIPDADAQLVAGDVEVTMVRHKGRWVMAFDDTTEEAATTPEITMPAHFGGGGLKAIIQFYMASDVTNDIAIDVFVEAKTPNADTLDMEASASWDSVNSGTKSVGSTTAGDPLTLEITLTNKDSVAVGDSVRFGIRRDTDSANDDAVGDMFISSVEIQETA